MSKRLWVSVLPNITWPNKLFSLSGIRKIKLTVKIGFDNWIIAKKIELEKFKDGSVGNTVRHYYRE